MSPENPQAPSGAGKTPLPTPQAGALALAAGLPAAAGAIGPWLLAATGHALPRTLAQAVVALSLAVLLGLALRWAFRTLGAELRADRWVGWGLLALMMVAVAVHFVGLAFEVGLGYYLDEGIYRAAAERINNGAPLPHNFIYGHLSHYLVAWILWLHRLFPAVTTGLATGLTGVADPFQVSWLWIRLWSGLCGALTTPAVFGIARRIVAGPSTEPSSRAQAAGFLGAGLITFATVYNEVSHVYISDVPAAFFATACLYFVSRLAGQETLRDYLWAGVAAGLSAACKYPAGVVAVAIAGVWLWWRWRERRWSWALLLAGAASLATFLLVMPAFLVHTGDAFAGQGRDVFFGVRQYAGSGWIGVAKDSNALWYGAEVLGTFGIGAVLLGLAGLFFLEREERRRFWVLTVFPLVYGLLICFLGVVVKRNLQPLLPMVAALLGVGAAALGGALVRRWPRSRPALGWVLALAVLAEPLTGVVRQEISLVRPGTREQVVDWVEANVPPGAGFVKESYTPSLDPARYAVRPRRFAVRAEPEELWSGRYDFVILAENAYGRFLREGSLRKEHQRAYAQGYRRLLALPRVFEVAPDRFTLGPAFSLHRLDPPAIEYRRERDFAAGDATFLSDPAMFRKAAGVLLYRQSGQWALFKEYLEPGRYSVNVDGEGPRGGTLKALTLGNEPLGDAAPVAGATIQVPARKKVFLYLQLPPGSRLRALHLRPAS